jgi:hypothetical protein
MSDDRLQIVEGRPVPGEREEEGRPLPPQPNRPAALREWVGKIGREVRARGQSAVLAEFLQEFGPRSRPLFDKLIAPSYPTKDRDIELFLQYMEQFDRGVNAQAVWAGYGGEMSRAYIPAVVQQREAEQRAQGAPVTNRNDLRPES